ncbi:hypothetical protein PsorP6_007598 [Peronosclerospora sorghi]|uniref:Uncharacterized protein n=1 Tax=Peronosclerospora sorghi TaxID=230839 RepID=A0ACC0WCA7_9STRA|nr:hypothetical protein PsorP6_007598 [Peronosclerospora sorghi]
MSLMTFLVKLSRKPEIQLESMQPPVCSSEQEILEETTDNDVVTLCGETGSGKTTRPRRVAAISTAKRVAEELNVPFGAPKGHVGYQIRYDAEHVSGYTRIKFMTDVILLKDIQQDFFLRPYSIILLD